MLKKIQTETMDSQWPKEGIFLKHPILVIPVTFLMVAGLKISRLWWILDIDMHIITKQRYVPLYSQNEQKIKSWLGLIFELNSNLQTNDLQNFGSQLLCPVFVYHVYQPSSILRECGQSWFLHATTYWIPAIWSKVLMQKRTKHYKLK